MKKLPAWFLRFLIVSSQAAYSSMNIQFENFVNRDAIILSNKSVTGKLQHAENQNELHSGKIHTRNRPCCGWDWLKNWGVCAIRLIVGSIKRMFLLHLAWYPRKKERRDSKHWDHRHRWKTHWSTDHTRMGKAGYHCIRQRERKTVPEVSGPGSQVLLSPWNHKQGGKNEPRGEIYTPAVIKLRILWRGLTNSADYAFQTFTLLKNQYNFRQFDWWMPFLVFFTESLKEKWQQVQTHPKSFLL